MHVHVSTVLHAFGHVGHPFLTLDHVLLHVDVMFQEDSAGDGLTPAQMDADNVSTHGVRCRTGNARDAAGACSCRADADVCADVA